MNGCEFSWGWFTLDLFMVLITVYNITDRMFTFDEDEK